MPAPSYFEIHADDCARAQKFYGDVFGWSFTRVDGTPIEYWSIGTNEPGGMPGGLMKRPMDCPAGQAVNAFVVTLGVSSLDDYFARATAAGAAPAMAKFAVQGLGWMAYLLDTEKNIFGIFQPDASAA